MWMWSARLGLGTPAVALTAAALGGPAVHHGGTPASSLPLPRAVGQLLIGTYAGPTPPAAMLAAVRAGHLGGVILMGNDTDDSLSVTRTAVASLQRAARQGKQAPLLIMTDQEGGEVKRLPGPPSLAADQMGRPATAYSQGLATGRMLRSVGVDLDLAPVADVTRTDGFMTRQQRTFGSSPAGVAAAACDFARGLVRAGVGYTLKHFPGLGDAVGNTDNGPVAVSEPANEIAADGAAYRRCGSAATAAVMVSSASYTHLTGRVPAVLDPAIYRHVLPGDHVDALTMTDGFESGAIQVQSDAARRAIAAGVDMVMYPNSESASAGAYTELLADAEHGTLSRQTVQAAAGRVLALKHALGLS